MKPNTRACVAYVAARLISKREASAIYDYSQSKYMDVTLVALGTVKVSISTTMAIPITLSLR